MPTPQGPQRVPEASSVASPALLPQTEGPEGGGPSPVETHGSSAVLSLYDTWSVGGRVMAATKAGLVLHGPASGRPREGRQPTVPPPAGHPPLIIPPRLADGTDPSPHSTTSPAPGDDTAAPSLQGLRSEGAPCMLRGVFRDCRLPGHRQPAATHVGTVRTHIGAG